MIDRDHVLRVRRQAPLLDLSHSAVYYRAVPISDDDLALMRRIDELHLEHPFAGSRMLKRLLRADGFSVGRSHVRTPMRRMGIEAIYRRPRTSQPHPDHRVFPYLLRGQVIDRPNQVWAGSYIQTLPKRKLGRAKLPQCQSREVNSADSQIQLRHIRRPTTCGPL